jgi:hypothetical protein
MSSVVVTSKSGLFQQTWAEIAERNVSIGAQAAALLCHN